MRFRSGLAIVFPLIFVLLFSCAALAESGEACLSCHEQSTPGVVRDWEHSRHSEAGIDCYTCHQASPSDSDSFNHNGFSIATIVSPEDCSTCHEKEVAEHNSSLHAKGYEFAATSAFYEIEGEAAKVRGCQQCHGSKVTVLENGRLDPATWPNNGIGRVNPDGSAGSCSACHTRHEFSVAEARKPESCQQCHLGPDHPQKEIYAESKHGAIYGAKGDSWNWDDPAGEWNLEDFSGPTCATCHISEFGGAKLTHNVSARLSWELQSPLSVKTENWQEKRQEMKEVCSPCHSSQWVDGFYKQADQAVTIYNDRFYKPNKEKMDQLYAEGLLTEDPYDEEVEWEFFELWHHEGRRARMGAFMGGPDYVHWHGFYDLAKDVVEIDGMIEELKHQ